MPDHAPKPPSWEEFAAWLHPTDVIEHYHQSGDLKPRSLVSTMLRDGLLQAAAGQLIIDGHDLGLALIPRDLWRFILADDFWSTARFSISSRRNAHEELRASGYDVRIDGQIREVPRVTPALPQRPVRGASSSFTGTKGGRPAARWWDALWIEIARQLYAGELKPDSQVLIEQAMHNWLAAQGIEAGETTIRDRARRLFHALTNEVEN